MTWGFIIVHPSSLRHRLPRQRSILRQTEQIDHPHSLRDLREWRSEDGEEWTGREDVGDEERSAVPQIELRSVQREMLRERGIGHHEVADRDRGNRVAL